MQIKHIFFDLDQTLWDFDKNSVLAFQTCFNQLNIQVDLNKFNEVYEPINESLWKLFGENKITKEYLKYTRLKQTFDALNMEFSDDLIYQISDDYLNMLPTFNHLHPGTLEVLEHLYPNYSLHIITNGFNEVSFRKVEQSGLSKYFENVITSENAGAKKPDARVFEYALQLANANIDESIMIGDNFEADVMGALNFGMKAIFYNYRNNIKPKNVTTIHQLVELKSLLMN